MGTVVRRLQKEVDPEEQCVFVKEEHIEDVKQGQKNTLDLLEWITEPPGIVKEELRLILFKMNQFRPGIQENGIYTFWMPGN